MVFLWAVGGGTLDGWNFDAKCRSASYSAHSAAAAAPTPSTGTRRNSQPQGLGALEVPWSALL